MSLIFLVDDDTELCEMIEMALRRDYTLEIAHDGKSAIERLKSGGFTAIVLDWQLPDMTGIEILKGVREIGCLTPILMLTGMKEVEDVIQGLDSGADDYLTKPFEMSELKARLRALIRGKGERSKGEKLRIKQIVLDPRTHKVEISNQPVELAAREFELLELFMSYPGRTYSLSKLRDLLWNGSGSDETIRACVMRLRQKLGQEAGELIETVPGMGYKIGRP
jgi:two-component system response regulator QseB